MKKYAIPLILLAVVLVAGIFAFMPVQQASTVHTTIQDTNTRLSAVLVQNIDTDINDFLITCPAASEGCIISDVILHDTDAVQDVNINSIDYTANSVAGDPTIVTISVQAIPANGVAFVNAISGMAMAGGDTIRIDLNDPGVATLVDIQVIATVEASQADITVGVIVH